MEGLFGGVLPSLAMLTLLMLACGGPEAPPPAPEPPQDPPVVVLVSWDTVRADATGPWWDQRHWGRDLATAPKSDTPNLDRLVDQGIRYGWAIAQAPTTLSSHASVFSGLDAHQHRVVRNGFPVPTEIPLITEDFAKAGWHTMGFIASHALAADQGLSRGFAHYEDHGGEDGLVMTAVPATTVVGSALAALDARTPAQKAQPTFLFVHFYDAHTPWVTAPPEMVAKFLDPAYDGPMDGTIEAMVKVNEQYVQTHSVPPADALAARARYLAQVHRVDQATGVLLRGLGERKMLNESLVAVFSDHGELFEDDAGPGPYGIELYSHSRNVDLAATHVPLALWGTGGFAQPAGTVVDTPVALQDLGPTVARLAGVQAGTPVLPGPWGAGQPTQPIFSEANFPVYMGTKPADGTWNNLSLERAVVDQGHILVHQPVTGEPPRLYRVAPEQPEAEAPAIKASLSEAIRAWDAAAPPHWDYVVPAETQAALEALGYVDG